jgi:NADH dehydrogenase/NADH:ubiquinone oxidoreductase subunit G
LNKPFIVGYIGSKINLTFPILHLGCSSSIIVQIAEGSHYFSKLISRSKNPLIILGKSLYNSLDPFVIDHIRSIFIKNVKNILFKKKDLSNWFGFSLLSTEASNYNKCEIGVQEKFNAQKDDDIFLIIGESKFKKTKASELAVYIGTHGNFFASNSDVILPSCSYVEKRGTFINCEGQIQQTNVATLAPGESREDYNILQAIQEYVFIRSGLVDVNDQVLSLLNDFVPISNCYKKTTAFYLLYYSCISNFTITFLPSSTYNNFYITNNITEFSPTMAKCSNKLLNKSCFI